MRATLSPIAWDGVLPLAVALIPPAVQFWFPRDDIAEVFAFVIAPTAAALFRGSLGWWQLAAVCGRRPPWCRQCLLAGAIILLLFFEMASAMLQFADDAPAEVWSIPATLYVLYIACIFCALRSEPATAEI